jgi:hypothetical protein
VAGENYNEDHRNLYSSPNIIRAVKLRRMRWAGHVAHMGEMRNSNKILVGRPDENKPLRRTRHRCEKDIKTDLQEIGLGVWVGFISLRIGTSGRLL